MKHLKNILLGALLLSSSVFGQAAYQTPAFVNLGTSVTNIAASTTNTTAGAILVLDYSPAPVRIWAYAEGNAGTTNGVSAVSNMVVRITTASGSSSITNGFDTASASNIKLTLSPLVTASNRFSDYFELRGARYIRIGQIENNYLGSVSNLQIIVGYPK